jgi:NTP pyrophosphatase (non-canonical NTP hydrolase)
MKLKRWRDDNNLLTNERMEKIKLEMGDVLWYYVGICNKLGISFNEILELNYKKLKSYDDYDEIVQHNSS